MLAERLFMARKLSGLSMESLGKQVGVSANMIKKYEHGVSVPNSTMLLSLSKAMQVPVSYFFRSMEVSLSQVEYRKKSSTSQKLLQKIEGEIIDKAERWQILKNAWDVFPIPAFKHPFAVSTITQMSEIDEIAERLRHAWNIGLNPIPNMIELLESKGIIVIVSEVVQSKLDGMQAMMGEQPIIVVSGHMAGDRQRFTLAHELGHLILQNALGGDIDEEKACHRFASAFLLPRIGICTHLGEERSYISPQELFLLKHEYGISMAAILRRALDLSIITQSYYKAQMVDFSKKGWRTQEPGQAVEKETTFEFAQWVYRAVSQELISETKGAELLNMSTFQLTQGFSLMHNGVDDADTYQ